MNKERRLGVARAFVAAKVYLARSMSHYDTSSSDLFICHALDIAREKNKISHDNYHSAKQVVQSRLYPDFTLDMWIINNVVDIDVDSPAFDDCMQQHRHAWLDKLIDEFSK